mgnify:CR=1 FL=1
MYEVDVVFSCGEDSYLPSVDVWAVIDVLRATTVITRWFELGGIELFPVKTTEEARSLVQELKERGSSPLLMGEVNGIPPEGFDLGNSPLDLNYDIIREHYCGVMSTTNGTVALVQAASSGSPVLAASFRNYSAVLDYALTLGRRIGLLCSGRKRRPSWEDTICAGAIIEELLSRGDVLLSDSAKISLSMWQHRGEDLTAYVKKSEHAIYLEQIGYNDDIYFSCMTDAATVVPMLSNDKGRNILRSVAGSARAYQGNDHANTIRPEAIHTAPITKPDPFEELLTYTKKTFVASKEVNE